MQKRPISVILISTLYIIAGITGVTYHAAELKEPTAEVFLTLIVRVLAIVGGIYALRAASWSRWLLTAWIAYHVILSMFHSMPELMAHGVVLLVTVFSLFNRTANGYFGRAPKSGGAEQLS